MLQNKQNKSHHKKSSSNLKKPFHQLPLKQYPNQSNEYCASHLHKIKQLKDKLEDLKINDTDLKIKNDQLIKMISQEPEEAQEIQERRKLWYQKFKELQKENQKKQQVINNMLREIQMREAEENDWVSRQLQEGRSMRRRRSVPKFQGLTRNQFQYIERIHEGGRERKKQRRGSICQKEYTANLPDGLIIKIIDRRSGVNEHYGKNTNFFR